MSTTELKLTALFFMVLDHIGVFIPGMPIVLRWVGRLSLPIFIFCTVEGFSHTHSKKRYMLRLYLAGIFMGLLNQWISIIGYTLSDFSPVKTNVDNNIFRTLFCISVLCFLIDSFQKKNSNRRKYLAAYCVWQVGVYLFLALWGRFLPPSPLSEEIVRFLPNLFGSVYFLEGGWVFLLLGVLLYLVKDNKKALAAGYFSFCAAYFAVTVTQFLPRVLIKLQYYAYVLGNSGQTGLSTALSGFEGILHDFCMRHSGLAAEYSSELNPFFTEYQWMMVGALPFLLAYNGKKGKGYKYFFYFFYPIHIYILYFIGGWIGAMS